MTEDFNVDDIAGDSNAGAYRKKELRDGPPLDYIAEKLANSLEHLHNLVANVANDLPESDTRERLLFSGEAAYQQLLVGFLGLHNMLQTANDPDLVKRLLSLSRDQFLGWLANIRSEGSVTGQVPPQVH